MEKIHPQIGKMVANNDNTRAGALCSRKKLIPATNSQIDLPAMAIEVRCQVHLRKACP